MKRYLLLSLILLVVQMLQPAGHAQVPEPEPAETDLLRRFKPEQFDIGPTAYAATYFVYLGNRLAEEVPAPVVLVLAEQPAMLKRIHEEWTLEQDKALEQFITVVPGFAMGPLYRTRGLALMERLLEDLRAKYRVDPDRIYLWGSRRGGQAAFSAARSKPDRFAGLIMQAGWTAEDVDLIEFMHLSKHHQHQLLRRLDLTYLPNMKHVPCLNMTGPADPAKGTALLAGQRLNRLGGHSRTLWVDVPALEAGQLLLPTPDQLTFLQAAPARDDRRDIHFRTDRLRHNQSGWIQILRFENYYETAEIQASFVTDVEGEINADVRNVTALKITPPAPAHHVRMNGQLLPMAASGSSYYQLRRGKWAQIDPVAVVVTEKYAGRAGPMDDVFSGPFVFVYGTRSDRREALQAWAEATAAGELFSQQDIFGNQRRPSVLPDTAVFTNQTLIESCHLICFGGPEDNEVARLSAPDPLPRALRPATDADTVVSMAVRPSPFSISHYALVVNPGPVVPRAPAPLRQDVDWLFYDSAENRVLKSGYFDSRWEPDEPPEYR